VRGRRRDQSIYTLARADVSILLSFSKDFPAARIIRLERNYRSTQNILNAAGQWSRTIRSGWENRSTREKGEGANLRYFEARDAQPRPNSSPANWSTS